MYIFGNFRSQLNYQKYSRHWRGKVCKYVNIKDQPIGSGPRSSQKISSSRFLPLNNNACRSISKLQLKGQCFQRYNDNPLSDNLLTVEQRPSFLQKGLHGQ